MAKDDKKKVNFVHRDRFLTEMFLKAERSVRPHTTFQINPLKKTHILPDPPTNMDPTKVMAKIKEVDSTDYLKSKHKKDPKAKEEFLWDPEAEEERQRQVNNRRMKEGLDEQMQERQKIKNEEKKTKDEEFGMVKIIKELYEQELAEFAQNQADAKKQLYKEIMDDIDDFRSFKQEEMHREKMEDKRTAQIQLDLLETYWKRKTTKKNWSKSGRSKHM